MKRTEPQKLGDVIRGVLEESNMTTRLRETQAAALWPLVVGEHIALQCGKPFVAAGILSVRVGSPALRNELYMNRSALIKAINDALGDDPVVREIRFLG